MTESQNNESKTNEVAEAPEAPETPETQEQQTATVSAEQLSEVRQLVGEANEMFRRVGIIESEKVNMMGYINQLHAKKKKFMEGLASEYGLDPSKLEAYQVDLDTGSIVEGDMPPQERGASPQNG